MAFRVRRVRLALAFAVLLVPTACNSTSPPSGPEATCAQACERTRPRCKRAAVRRGCNLVLDRLAEGEGDHVIACVAQATQDAATTARGPAAPRASGSTPTAGPRPSAPLATSTKTRTWRAMMPVPASRHRRPASACVDFGAPPRRVVSLVPSDTLHRRRARAARAPSSAAPTTASSPPTSSPHVPSVGGTKNPRVDDIVRARAGPGPRQPGGEHEGDLEALAQRGVRVYVAFPKRVADGLAHLARLARIFGVEGDAAVARALEARLRRAPRGGGGPRGAPRRCARSVPSG